MAVTINADTSNGLVMTPDTSGEIKLQSAGTDIATVNSSGITMASGKVLAPTGPAFSAYLSSSQTPTLSTWTRVNFDTEVFDTNSNFASSTFTPTVAGYYQINAKFRGNISTSTTSILVALYKNGNIYDTLARSLVNNANLQTLSVSSLVYMNGTTDYIELFVNMQGTGTPAIYGDALYRNACNINGVLVRAS